MALVKTQMTAIGNEPQTCIRPFDRGEIMYAVEYNNGEVAGWHTGECIDYWGTNGIAKCAEQETK